MEYLINFGADISQISVDGFTAIDYAFAIGTCNFLIFIFNFTIVFSFFSLNSKEKKCVLKVFNLRIFCEWKIFVKKKSKADFF